MDTEERQPLRVVVLGGSAGSIEALGTVLGALPPNPGFAVLVITHLDPTEETQLPEVLQGRTALPVERLEHLRRIEHDRVFVMPENAGVIALDGHLRLTRRQPGLHLPIDACLASMAQDPDVDAAVAILSGTGQDGAAGIVDLKAAGGLVIAQAPQSAEHDGMPTAAINTGLVDEVLPPADIAAALVRRFGDPAHALADTALGESQSADALETALAIVQQKAGVNLAYVKDVNLRRRFLRRVLLQKDRDVGAYLHFLRADPHEAAALRDDVLIGVTAFFRDAEFVNVLRQVVLPKLLELRHDPIRIWVPACSTGEEVYTIAMLLKEAMNAEGISRRVQIFGTDINEASIETARAGRYAAAALENVPQPFRDTAFVPSAGGYLVAKDLREMCVFARHNLLAHAPFSGMGLISCRNMLIYLRKEAQQHVFEVLHYATRADGFLLLGRAEATSASDGFEHAGAPHLYRKLANARRQRPLFPIDALRPWANEGSAPRPTQAPPPDLVSEAANRVALARYAPPGFVVNEEGDVVQFRGEVAPFIAPASGEATLALPRLLHAELNVPVRTALIEAKRTAAPVRRERVAFNDRRYSLEVLPLETGEALQHFLVTLAPQVEDVAEPAGAAAGAPRARVDELERTVTTLSDELEGTQAQLRTLVIEFESANEELRTANEEMLSTNEELQSANEELQSAKQELESANQELISLNEELKSRNDQLDLVNDDLSNLVEGIPLPVVLLDRQLKLRHASPQAAQLFGLGANAVGQPIGSVSNRFAIGHLEQLVQAAVQGLAPVEHELQDSGERWWMINVRAYRTADDRIDGAVIAFQDIHELKCALGQAQHARGDAERANTAKDDFLGMVSHELRAPLNVIAGWASVLKQAQERGTLTDATATRAIATILKHCQSQAQLIDDLLDVSRISSGHLALDMRPLDLAGSVRAVTEGLTPTAEGKGLALRGTGLQQAHRIQGDARRVQQIVANLLGNAIKFTPSGGRISVTLSRLGPTIELAVTDTGIGVAPDLLPTLFDRFTQADISRTREYGGLGLGLSIVRHLVQAHGGTVAAHSEGEGRGARLTVRFPAIDLTSEALTPATAASGETDLHGLRVLVVDDDPNALEALTHLLAAAGAEVASAGSVEDAWRVIDTAGGPDGSIGSASAGGAGDAGLAGDAGPAGGAAGGPAFHALISDVAMPGADGYALIRRLRQRELGAGALPVYAVALTGLATLQDRDAAIAAGFDDHVAKPVDADRLIEKLQLARPR